jgi:hypothetical protein
MRKYFPSLLSLLLCSLLPAQQVPVNTPSAPPPPPPAAATPTGPPQPHTLLDGTPVKLRLSQTISSADAKVGQEIPFEVVEEVKVDDVVVLSKGATAIGTVTECNAKKSMGRAGKLNMNISYARLTDQEKVALRATQDNKGGGHVGAMTGAMVATAVVFFPAAPLFLFIKGKDITIPQGTEITAFVEGDMHLNMANFAPAPASAAPAAPVSTQASLVIDSAPTGADIVIDGAFVGNTPSTVPVAIGNHEITVQKKGFANWTRKLSVAGGSIHLDADLDPAPAPAQAGAAAPATAPSVAPSPVAAPPPAPAAPAPATSL